MGIADFFKGLGSNVMDNRQALGYLLANYGADISAGGGEKGITAANNLLSSQKYLKLLQQMLGGNVPEGGSINYKGGEGGGMTIKVPSIQSAAPVTTGQNAKFTNDFGVLDLGSNTTRPVQLSGLGEVNPNITGASASQGGRLLDLVNPFVGSQQGIPNLKLADLAGLTPETISQALQFKFAQEELGQKKITDMVDAMYKAAGIDLDRQTLAQRVKEFEQSKEYQTAQTEVDRIKAMTDLVEAINKDDRTELQKNYEYATAQGYEGSLMDFKSTATDPSSVREYEYAVKGSGYKGSYVDFILEKTKAGAAVTQNIFGNTLARMQAQSLGSDERVAFEKQFENASFDFRSEFESWKSEPTHSNLGAAEAREKFKQFKVMDAIQKNLYNLYGQENVKRPIGGTGWEIKTDQGTFTYQYPY